MSAPPGKSSPGGTAFRQRARTIGKSFAHARSANDKANADKTVSHVVFPATADRRATPPSAQSICLRLQITITAQVVHGNGGLRQRPVRDDAAHGVALRVGVSASKNRAPVKPAYKTTRRRDSGSRRSFRGCSSAAGAEGVQCGGLDYSAGEDVRADLSASLKDYDAVERLFRYPPRAVAALRPAGPAPTMHRQAPLRAARHRDDMGCSWSRGALDRFVALAESLIKSILGTHTKDRDWSLLLNWLKTLRNSEHLEQSFVIQISPDGTMTDADALRGLKERLDTFGARVQTISQSPENFMQRYLGRNKLGIVAITENHPSLLLDRLGDPQGPLPTNRKAVNDLMATKSNLIYLNVPGSGKTANTFGLLLRRPGFYFTCAEETIGSRDLSTALRNAPQATGFMSLTEAAISPAEAEAQLQANVKIAYRYLQRPLVARTLLYDRFIKEFKDSTMSENQKNRLWVLLQAQPLTFFEGRDPFVELFVFLKHPRSGWSTNCFEQAWERISKHLRYKPLEIVIDEVDAPSRQNYSNFRGGNDNADDNALKRPILRELNQTLNSLFGASARMIWTGTAIKADTIHLSVSSGVNGAKGIPPEKFSFTGEFKKTNDDQREFILFYLATPGTSISLDLERLIGRAKQWLSGSVFRRLTGEYPPDRVGKVEISDQDLLFVDGLIRPTLQEAFRKDELRAYNLFASFNRCISMSVWEPPKEDEIFVQECIGQFDPSNFNEVVGLYAMYHALEKSGHSVQQYIKLAFATARGTSRGNVYEEMLATQIFHNFTKEGGVALDSVLDFRNNRPSWASKKFMLANLSRTDQDVISEGDFSGSFPMAIQAKDSASVLQWLKDPRSVSILLPDNDAGPDGIVLLQEASNPSNKILFGWQSKLVKRLEVKKALQSLLPKLWYHSKRSATPTPVGTLCNDMHVALKSLGYTAEESQTVLVLACPSGQLQLTANTTYIESYPFAILQPGFLEKSADYSALLLQHLNHSALGTRKRTKPGDSAPGKDTSVSKKQKKVK
ncbi:hypothetical protein GGX14DRAFT_650246 [Mycena pura]|uniref:Uncharacterized protein n=1 Tax=Mycena pura TaxID=153505 RepID=A0AAD6YN79_9AGAR|nr:hypothetical protein GGX14DRAFT_650246 [Mycena pura]